MFGDNFAQGQATVALARTVQLGVLVWGLGVTGAYQVLSGKFAYTILKGGLKK